MADHTQTVTNAMSLFGPSAGNQWNFFLWGTGNWGASEDIGTGLDKAPLTETITLTVALPKDFVKDPLNNTVNLSSDISSIMRAFGIWDYVFTRPTSDGDSKLFDQFSLISVAGDDFSQVSDGSTTWTGV